MKRGPKPRPTAINIAAGTYDKNPNRRRDAEPDPPKGYPECPGTLDEVAQIEWWYICGLLDEMGILSLADKSALELYCHTYSEWRKACESVAKYGAVLVNRSGDKVDAKRNPFDVVRERNAQMCAKLLAEFGLTPSSRARVEVRQKPKDDFEAWEAKSG